MSRHSWKLCLLVVALSLTLGTSLNVVAEHKSEVLQQEDASMAVESADSEGAEYWSAGDDSESDGEATEAAATAEVESNEESGEGQNYEMWSLDDSEESLQENTEITQAAATPAAPSAQAIVSMDPSLDNAIAMSSIGESAEGDLTTEEAQALQEALRENDLDLSAKPHKLLLVTRSVSNTLEAKPSSNKRTAKKAANKKKHKNKRKKNKLKKRKNKRKLRRKNKKLKKSKRRKNRKNKRRKNKRKQNKKKSKKRKSKQSKQTGKKPMLKL